MMSNKNKGILIFAILYTVLFVFDGVKLLAFLMPSAIANYLVYVVLALYGSFLCKDRLIKQWNEIRKTKRKFFFGVLTGWLFLFLMTFVFEFVSEMLKQFFGLVGQGLNQSNIQSTFQEQPILIAVFACIIGPFVEELFFRQLLLHHLQKSLPSWLSILLVGFIFALTHMHNLSLSEWVGAVGYLGGGLAFLIIFGVLCILGDLNVITFNVEKYFQIAKCFRDEDLRADRQPEFTQLDIEMSFVEKEDVMNEIEGLAKYVFKNVTGEEANYTFQRMPYAEAMDRFGSDKPDLRFGVELKDLSDIVKNSSFNAFSSTVQNGGLVKAVVAPNANEKFSRKFISEYEEYVKTYFGAKGLAYIKLTADGITSPIAKFLSEDEMKAIIEKTQAKTGDVIFIVADKRKVVVSALGALRLKIGKAIWDKKEITS